MKHLKQKFSVDFEYPVYFTEGLFEEKNLTFANIFPNNPKYKPKIIFFIDSNVNKNHINLIGEIELYFQKYTHLPTLVENPVIIQGGEITKNSTDYINQIYELVEKHKICRHSYILALGGGAMLDMIGYAASTAHRGINLIRVPTTVLSQNDSGIGVKNAINFFDKKNFLGCFTTPYAVINDFKFLTTLDKRDWLSGIAEAIKVALIKDKDFFDFIEKNAAELKTPYNMKPMRELIYRCAELHLNHIGKSGDPFERGSSRPLDFGHWSAHKLERLTNYDLRHGEAVAIGIALDSTYSYLTGLLPKTHWQRILNTITALGFKIFTPELSNYSQTLDSNKNIFKGLAEFQEHLGGNLTIMLLQKIGKGIDVNEVEIKQYEAAIEILEKFSKEVNETRQLQSI